jgi:hypothetical protein
VRLQEVLDESLSKKNMDWGADGAHYVIYPSGKFESAGQGHEEFFKWEGEKLLKKARPNDIKLIKKLTYKEHPYLNKGELDDFDKLADKGGFITCMYYGYIFITSDSPTSGKRFSVGVVYLRGRVTNKAINKMKEFLEYLVDEHGKTLGNFRVWTNYKADQGRSDKEQKVMDII